MNLPYPCTYDGCSKAFLRPSRLEIHIRTHTGERPFVCVFPGCQSSYARSQHLSRHIERVHTPKFEFPEKVICPHCEVELANSTHLKIHVKTVHSNNDKGKVYKCSEDGCGEAFHKKQQLIKHRLSHDESIISAMKCYRCPHDGCDKEFVFPGRLRRHMKVHQGYPCDVSGCEEILPNWSRLRKHKATVHCPTYPCDTCGSVFKTKSNLTQHQKVHLKDHQPILCTWEGCDRSFLYKKNMRQHIRSFHKGEQVFKKQLKAKPRKPRKKISLAAHIFGLDDRGKELKVSRHKRSTDPQGEEETCLRLSSAGPELDVFLSTKGTDDSSSSSSLKANSVETTQCQNENVPKSSTNSLKSSMQFDIVSALPTTGTSFPQNTDMS